MPEAENLREEAAFHSATGRTSEGAPSMPGAKARQGLGGTQMLTVLGVSIALLTVGFVIVGFAAGYFAAV